MGCHTFKENLDNILADVPLFRKANPLYKKTEMESEEYVKMKMKIILWWEWVISNQDKLINLTILIIFNFFIIYW